MFWLFSTLLYLGVPSSLVISVGEHWHFTTAYALCSFLHLFQHVILVSFLLVVMEPNVLVKFVCIHRFWRESNLEQFSILDGFCNVRSSFGIFTLNVVASHSSDSTYLAACLQGHTQIPHFQLLPQLICILSWLLVFLHWGDSPSSPFLFPLTIILQLFYALIKHHGYLVGGFELKSVMQ